MFIHCVLFRIKKKNVRVYKRDCALWKREAKRHPGFQGCHAMASTDKPGQFASLYFWKDEKFHRRFMGGHHDRLVSLSRCPVTVLGYFNFKTA